MAHFMKVQNSSYPMSSGFLLKLQPNKGVLPSSKSPIEDNPMHNPPAGFSKASLKKLESIR